MSWFKFHEDFARDPAITGACSQCPEIVGTWVLLCLECVRLKTDTIKILDEHRTLGFGAPFAIMPGKIVQSLRFLDLHGYIKMTDATITVCNWNTLQSEYLRRTIDGHSPVKRRTMSCQTTENIRLEERRGEEKRRDKRRGEKPPIAASPLGVEHQAFIKGWVENFKEFHGMDYVFEGGRDGKAVKNLLAIGIVRLDLLEMAKGAWKRSRDDRFARACRLAATIHGFNRAFNEIRVELKNGEHQAKPTNTVLRPNPRCAGVIESVSDYATAKPRFQREREEAAQRATMAGQVAANANNPPADKGGAI